MILHRDDTKELLFYPEENYRVFRFDDEITVFLKYAEAARAGLKTIIIVAPGNLSLLPKRLRKYIKDLGFERIKTRTVGYWRLELNNE